MTKMDINIHALLLCLLKLNYILSGRLFAEKLHCIDAHLKVIPMQYVYSCCARNTTSMLLI